MKRLFFERRIQILALAAGSPAVITALLLLWTGDYPAKVRWTVTAVVLLAWIGVSSLLRERVASPLRTLASLLEAMREGDFSIRARGARGEDTLGEVMLQVNAMSSTLRAQRLGAMEATTLLRKVMEEIDVAIFAFDAERRLRLVNRSGEKLLGHAAEKLLRRDAEELGLAEFLTGDPSRTVQRTFSSAAGRWGIARSVFREGGLPHHLLVLTDLTRALREEELQAWQRMVRVFGHELNNSLAPIKSIAESLGTQLDRPDRPGDWDQDARHGLAIIASRSEALSRFLGAYAKLVRLPRPNFGAVDVGALVRRVVRLETRLAASIIEGPRIQVRGDEDQLEQLLINLLRNAVEASPETGGAVTVSWTKEERQVAVVIRDEGPGLANTANLFVPFFTTKPGGSGIGLVLSRQIAEAHGGSLTVQGRSDSPGCEARLVLPG